MLYGALRQTFQLVACGKNHPLRMTEAPCGKQKVILIQWISSPNYIPTADEMRQP